MKRGVFIGLLFLDLQQVGINEVSRAVWIQSFFVFFNLFPDETH